MDGEIPRWLAELVNLTTFSVKSNKMTGGIPAELAGCVELEVLDVSSNALNGALPDALSKLVNLRVLSLRSNNFHGSIPSWLSTFNLLQVLDLSQNRFSGTIPTQFSQLSGFIQPSLAPFNATYDLYNQDVTISVKGLELTYAKLFQATTILDLSSNNLTGTIPSGLGFLIAVRILNLSNNHLDGAIPERFGNLSVLESLDLSGNQLSRSIPTNFVALFSLEALRLAGNNLSGPIPQTSQITSLNVTSFKPGNDGLCGFPLPRSCSNNRSNSTFPYENSGADSFISLPAFGIGVLLAFTFVSAVVRSRRLQNLVQWHPKVRVCNNYHDRQYGAYRSPA